MKINTVAATALALITAFSLPLYAQHSHSNHSHESHAGHGHDHGHHHAAPHGGTLVVFGNEAAHLELVLDNKSGTLTGYVLNNEADSAVRIKQPEIRLVLDSGDLKTTTMPISLKAVENPLTGEKKGDTSQFEVTNDKLKKLKKFNVTVELIEIKGAKFEKVRSPFPEGNHP